MWEMAQPVGDRRLPGTRQRESGACRLQGLSPMLTAWAFEASGT